jgi:hypothetical protein
MLGTGRAGLAATLEFMPPNMDLSMPRTSHKNNSGMITRRNKKRIIVRNAV